MEEGLRRIFYVVLVFALPMAIAFETLTLGEYSIILLLVLIYFKLDKLDVDC